MCLASKRGASSKKITLSIANAKGVLYDRQPASNWRGGLADREETEDERGYTDC
jgi:hypothetical protein